MTWGAVATAAGTAIAGGISANSARREADKQRRAIRSQNDLAQNAFSPVNFNGPGGASVNFGGTRTPSLVAGGVDFGALAGLGTTGSGGSFFGNPGSGADFRTGGQQVLPGGSGGLVGQPQFFGATDINPNSGAAIDPTGRIGETPFNTDLGALNINLGDLDPARAGLAQLALQNIGNAGLSSGIANDPRINQLFQQFNQLGGQVGQTEAGVLNPLLGGAGAAFGGAAQDLFSQQANPFQAGLQQALFGGAQNAFANLPGTQQQARDQQLSLLREQAAPFEERAFADLQNNLFSTGRIGTTGGALQTEAFARGLGQADLQRQISAANEGRLAQNAQLGLAQGQLGAGQGLRSLQDQLLGSAQNRFTGLANLSSGLGAQATQNQGTQLQAIQNLLSNSQLPQNLALAQQGAFLQNALSGLGGVSSLVGDARQSAALASSIAQAQANARLGGVASSQIAPQDLSTSTAFAQLAQGLGGNIGDVVTAFQNRPAQTSGGNLSGFNSTSNVDFSSLLNQIGGGT